MLSRNDNFEDKLSKSAYERIYSKRVELNKKLNNEKYENYNCHSAAIAGSLHYSLESFGAMYDTDQTNALYKYYDNVTENKAIFGRTVITFGDQHSVLFLGKSRDGIVSVFTKNGAYFAPKVMKLNVIEKYRSYGSVRNIDMKSGSGYYNPKHVK